MECKTYYKYYDVYDEEQYLPSTNRNICPNGIRIHESSEFKKVKIYETEEIELVRVSTMGCGCCSDDVLISKADYIKLLKNRISEIQEIITNLEES